MKSNTLYRCVYCGAFDPESLSLNKFHCNACKATFFSEDYEKFLRTYPDSSSYADLIQDAISKNNQKLLDKYERIIKEKIPENRVNEYYNRINFKVNSDNTTHNISGSVINVYTPPRKNPSKLLILVISLILLVILLPLIFLRSGCNMILGGSENQIGDININIDQGK